MSKTPLIPTVIVDKNGRRTTVHRKDGSDLKQSANTIPAPTTNTSAEKRSLQSHIAYELAEIDINDPKMDTHGLLTALDSMSVSDLWSLRETTQKMKLLDEGERSIKATETLLRNVHSHNFRYVQIIKDHGEKVSGHLNMHDVVTLVQVLRAMDTDTESFTANTDAHIYAAGRYLSKSGIPSNYYIDKDFLQFINRNPEHVDAALAYRAERNPKEFDDDQFKDWREAGVLRDGAL